MEIPDLSKKLCNLIRKKLWNVTILFFIAEYIKNFIFMGSLCWCAVSKAAIASGVFHKGRRDYMRKAGIKNLKIKRNFEIPKASHPKPLLLRQDGNNKNWHLAPWVSKDVLLIFRYFIDCYFCVLWRLAFF